MPAYASQSFQVGPGFENVIDTQNDSEALTEENIVIEELDLETVSNEEEEDVSEKQEEIKEEENSILEEKVMYGKRGERVLNRNSIAEYMTDEEILNWYLNYYHMNIFDFNPLMDEIILESAKNQVFYESRYDVAREFYDLAQVSNEEKLAAILEYSHITLEQANVVAAAISKEGRDGGTDYGPSYLVANNIFGRQNSVTWRAYCGNTIYDQVMKKGQYEVITKKMYLENLGRTDLMSYQAFLDRGYVEAMNGKYQLYSTPYLGFRAKGKGKEILPRDNHYRDLQADSDRFFPRPIYQPETISFLAEEESQDLFDEITEQVQTASLKLIKK